MKDQIARIITMLQEGKINSNEAEELISALKEPERATGNKYLNKMFKIRIKSESKDDVHVNIPLKLVKSLLKMGHGIAANIPQASKYAEDLDVDLLINAIDNEVAGKIIDVQSANGDTVAVYIE